MVLLERDDIWPQIIVSKNKYSRRILAMFGNGLRCTRSGESSVELCPHARIYSALGFTSSV